MVSALKDHHIGGMFSINTCIFYEVSASCSIGPVIMNNDTLCQGKSKGRKSSVEPDSAPMECNKDKVPKSTVSVLAISIIEHT